jgi:enediyne biosynthesis protein E4
VGGVCGDFNNNGFFDLITTARNGLCTLHRSVGGQAFQDVTTTAGVVTPRGYVWGPAWGDVDNDGDLDLFIPDYFSTNLMFLNNGDGTFTSVDIGSPLREGVNDECAVWVDYDNDGFLDLFVACGEAAPSPNLLYRNNLPATGNTNHWLNVKLDGRASNRSGIGAKIRVRAVIRGSEVWQLRQIASNGAFASGTELIAHFGLGDATNVTMLRIEWSSGIVQELPNVAANQFLTVVESQGYTNTPPAFAGATKDASGLQLSITEPAAGARYILEASPDMVTWTKLLARTSTGGTCQFTNINTASYPKRFYRLQVP